MWEGRGFTERDTDRIDYRRNSYKSYSHLDVRLKTVCLVTVWSETIKSPPRFLVNLVRPTKERRQP